MTEQIKSNEMYAWLLHIYREFGEFEIPTYLGGKSWDCKKKVWFD